MSTDDRLADILREWFNTQDSPYRAGADKIRAQFVVFDRDALPAITSQAPGLFGTVHGHETTAISASWHRDLAMHHLAIAQHRESLSPPVDPAHEGKVRKVRYALTQALGPTASHSPLDRLPPRLPRHRPGQGRRVRPVRLIPLQPQELRRRD